MKKLSIVLLLSASFPMHAFNDGIIEERIEYDRDGSPVVVRTSEESDSRGGSKLVEQRIRPLGNDTFSYEFDEQSEATKAYHRSLCAASDMEPSQGGESTFSGIAAWGCHRSLMEGEQLQGVPLSNTRATSPGDFIRANAPSGTVQRGKEFTAVGYLQFQSSEAGVLSGTVSVDSRCSSHFLSHYPEPFAGEYYAEVACTVHEAGTVHTALDACTPRQCAADAGVMSAQ